MDAPLSFLPTNFFTFSPPAFLLYTASVVAVTLVLILYCSPRYGQTNILIYIGICSMIGSLTVSCSTVCFCNVHEQLPYITFELTFMWRSHL